MRLPRNLSGEELCFHLKKYGYQKTRQTGSHVRLTSSIKGDSHHVTIPLHSPLKAGTLNGVLNDISKYIGIEKKELIEKLFD